ncbi:MAG: cytochrome c peroxidase [bacterium]|nr:cytochrome c peroxidase [bacterium]
MKLKNAFSLIAVCLVALSFTFCKKPTVVNPLISDSNEVPLLPEKPVDYPASQNDYLAALGRVLFYDKDLSSNKNIACGSCHQQEHAFCDNLQFSPGTNNLHTKRNTPSIFARNSRLFWDGRSNSLQDLVFRPVRDKVEMNTQDVPLLIDRIARTDYYVHLFPYAFPNAKKIDSSMIKMALAEFLKNFNFSNSKFKMSQQGAAFLSESETLGKTLFFGKAKCSQCHHVENDKFASNTGGYGSTNESHNIGLDVTNSDLGVGAISHNAKDEGAFMMPVLLNIEFTSPYMHDGRFKTLEEVVDHYDSGIKNNPNLDFILRSTNGTGGAPQQLNLSAAEKKSLVDFLKTLSDPTVLTDVNYSNPFVPR